MKKFYNVTFTAVLVGTMLAAALPACAQDVTVTGGPCTLQVIPAASVSSPEDAAQDGATQEAAAQETAAQEALQTQEIQAEAFRIFAQNEDGYVLIRTGSEDLYVNKDELSALLPELDLDSFPYESEVAALPQGTGGEETVSLQNVLISLGYLSGSADGAYGSGTADAVRRFQEDHGLEATGSADVYTMMLIKAVENGLEDKVEVSSKGFTTPEEKFPEIAGRTDADLSAFMESRWRYRYDTLEEKGEIDPGIDLGGFVVEAPAIDEIIGDMALKAVIYVDEKTKDVAVVPAITVESEGAYRPYVQGAILTGESTVRLEEGKSTGEIDGVTLKESGYVPLTPEAMDLLATGSVKTIRLLGKNTSYDVDVEYDAEAMAAFMEACRTIG